MLTATASFAADSITVVADEWPPFSGNQLPAQGISIDVTRAVLERAGYEVETLVLPWARVVNGAKTGEFDIVTSLFMDAEMQSFLHYSDPFFETEIRFVQKLGGGAAFNGLKSLEKYTIAVGTGFLYEPDFDKADFLNKFEVTTTLQGLKMVAANRVDLTLDSTHVVRHSLLLETPDLLDQIEFLEPALAEQKIHMAVSQTRPDHKKIVEDFNRTLAEMQADGSFADLLSKHIVD